jgi:hypothetical protein
MVCDSCGADLTGQHERCPSCGAPIGLAAPAPLPPPTAPPPTAPVQAAGRSAGGESELVIATSDPTSFGRELFGPPAAATGSPTGSTSAVDQLAPPSPGVTAAVETAAPATDATLTSTPMSGSTATATSTMAALPTVFDGDGDVDELPHAREGFKLRVMFVLAVFGAVAVALVPAANMIDIRTSRPVDGIEPGYVELQQFGTNLTVASYVAVVAMVLGALIACWSVRWAAGLAGGAGLALIGWAALVIGLVEARLEIAEEITRTFPPDRPQFELTITRDLGYGLVIGVAALGLLVFLASLRLSRAGGRPGLNPWIAAVGAVSALVLAVGPLIPVNGASFSDNFRTTLGAADLPAAYVWGRIAQITIIGVIGAIGFLLVRTYGLGLTAGTISVAAWMWYSSLGEIGDDPLDIADRNVGALDTKPHAVTTVGMVLSLAMLLIAAIAAFVQHRRYARR